MDELTSHISPSEASHSEGRSETRSEMVEREAVKAVEYLVFDCASETQSEKQER